MEYQNTRYAVVKKPNPEAALYFEHAYCLHNSPLSIMSTTSDIFQVQKPKPIEGFALIPDDKIGNWYDAKSEITELTLGVIKRNFIADSRTDKLLHEIEKSIKEYGKAIHGQRSDLISSFRKINEDINFDANEAEIFLDNLMISATTAYYRKQGLYTVPVLENVDSPNWIRGNSLEDGIELALLDLPLVKSENIEWGQVKEIRNDESSIQQLRRLRLFLDGLDHSKGKAYIQDLLLTKVEDYEKAATKHGFKTGKAPLKAFLSMKNIPKLLSYGICALLNPGLTSVQAVMAGLGSAELSGAVKEIGDIGLSIKEKKVMKEYDGENKEIEYLVSIKKKLEEK